MFRRVGVFTNVVFASVGVAAAPQPLARTQQPPRLPPIARIAGVWVGHSTVEELERRLGPGTAYTGGHPQGAREWRSRQTGWYVNADGFNYGRHGRVLDEVSVSTDRILHRKNEAATFAPRKLLRFMGVVELEMTRYQVVRALARKLPPPRMKGRDLVWTALGYARLNSNSFDDKHEWTATLHFEQDRLTSISVGS
jgi:hypothetical protein